MGMLLRRHYDTSSSSNTEQVEASASPAHVVKEAESVVIAEDKKITKTEINRMAKDDLVVLAEKNGISVDGKSGTDLKKELIEKLA